MGALPQEKKSKRAWKVDWVPVWVDVGVRDLSFIFIAHLAPNSFMLNRLAGFSRSAILIRSKVVSDNLSSQELPSLIVKGVTYDDTCHRLRSRVVVAQYC